MKNKQEILDRLEYEQDGDDFETWIDPITQKKYYVPIELIKVVKYKVIERDFDNLKEII